MPLHAKLGRIEAARAAYQLGRDGGKKAAF